MIINRNLNLVIPVERDDATIYFHSTPIGREVYEGSFRVIAAAHAEIFGPGGAYVVNGIKIAALTLKTVGTEMAEAKGRAGDMGAAALLGEIKRLTTVIAPSGAAWEPLPVDVAIQRKIISADEWAEAESAIVFFTLNSWMSDAMMQAMVEALITGVTGLSTTPLPPTGWTASLPTLKTEQSTPPPTSSIPS